MATAEQNLKRLDEMHASCVYAIGPAEERYPIKLSVSSAVLKRYRALQSASPVPLDVFGVMRCPFAYEARIHAALAEHRAHGDWFRRTPDTMQVVRILAGSELRALDEWLRGRV